MEGRWRTAYTLAKNISRTSITTIAFEGDSVAVNDKMMPVHFKSLEKLDGLKVSFVPTPSLTGVASFIDYYRTVNLIMKGAYYKDINIFKYGLKESYSMYRKISRDVASIFLPKQCATPSIIGLLESYNIRKDANGFNLFLYHAAKTWDHSMNTYDRLINTTRAFLKKAPPMHDNYSEKQKMLAETKEDLKKIYNDEHKKPDFIKEANNHPRDITFANRYLPIAEIIINYLKGNDLLDHPLIKNFGKGSEVLWKGKGTEKPRIKILEVGGAPYSVKHGAPALRQLLEVLKKQFPGITFEVTVTDIEYPEGFEISKSTPKHLRRDEKHKEITYRYHDITTGNIHGYDIVICSRVLTQKYFDREKPSTRKNYVSARNSLYDALIPGGVLFLDQGQSHFMEVWRKREEKIDEDNYVGLVYRIDNWFMVDQLKIFGEPNKYLRKYFKGECDENERRIIAKYFSVFNDPDKIQANLLWKICMPNSPVAIHEDLKEKLLPGVLHRIRITQPLQRKQMDLIIYSLANLKEVDLSDVEALNRMMNENGLPFEVDKVKLMEAKLERCGLSTMIPRAIRTSARDIVLPEGDFFALGGMITDVEVKEGNILMRMKFMNWNPETTFVIEVPSKKEEDPPYTDESMKVVGIKSGINRG